MIKVDPFFPASCIMTSSIDLRMHMITPEHIKTDFLIIGGGVAGLRAAVELRATATCSS